MSARRWITLVVPLMLAAGPANAEPRTYMTFTPSVTYQVCFDFSLYASGSGCQWPSGDAVFERELTADPDGSFVNSLRGTGGNRATAIKARATTKQLLTVVLGEPLPSIDLTFVYRLDALHVGGDSDCGLVMAGGGPGCTYARGNSQLEVTAPPGGHVCADGTDATASYPFGYTYFGTTIRGADTPGTYTGGYYLQCHASAVSAGVTVKLSLTTRTQVSPNGNGSVAAANGRLLSATLA